MTIESPKDLQKELYKLYSRYPRKILFDLNGNQRRNATSSEIKRYIHSLNEDSSNEISVDLYPPDESASRSEDYVPKKYAFKRRKSERGYRR
jgi:hypothetical protein